MDYTRQQNRSIYLLWLFVYSEVAACCSYMYICTFYVDACFYSLLSFACSLHMHRWMILQSHVSHERYQGELKANISSLARRHSRHAPMHVLLHFILDSLFPTTCSPTYSRDGNSPRVTDSNSPAIVNRRCCALICTIFVGL